MTMKRSWIALALATAVLPLSAAVPTATASATSANRSASHSRVVASVAGSTHLLLGPATFGVTVQQDPLAYVAVRFADGGSAATGAMTTTKPAST